MKDLFYPPKIKIPDNARKIKFGISMEQENRNTIGFFRALEKNNADIIRKKINDERRKEKRLNHLINGHKRTIKMLLEKAKRKDESRKDIMRKINNSRRCISRAAKELHEILAKRSLK